MSRHELLNNITHKDLKVINRYSAEYGDNVNSVLTFPTEYADIQREYPIFFKKDAQNEYQSVAILGFAKGENLFLGEDEWLASYVPAMIARGPFLIGFQEQEVDGATSNEPVIHVNMDDPRVSESEGEALFLPHGGNTEYLQRIATILKGIHHGIALGKRMFQAFESHALIEPVSVEFKLNENEVYTLSGYYTISEEKLAALDGEALEDLNRQGFLQAAFLVLASLQNVKKLIDIKNRERAAGDTA